MNTSNPNHAAWCTEHRGDLCRSKTWTVASLSLCLFGAATDDPPVHVDVRMPAPVQGVAHAPSDAGQLAEAFRTLTMLAAYVPPCDDPDGVVAYWTARMDVLTERSS